jgi:hypothetical protein
MPELGNKFECYSCGAKFYDLGKPQPICPKCGANQKDAVATKPAHESAAHRRKRKEEPVREVEEGDEPGAVAPDAEAGDDAAEHEEEEADDTDAEE